MKVDLETAIRSFKEGKTVYICKSQMAEYTQLSEITDADSEVGCSGSYVGHIIRIENLKTHGTKEAEADDSGRDAGNAEG